MRSVPWTAALDVARWEFRRWFKPRDQIMTLILSIVIGLAVWGGAALLDRSRSGPVTVAVLGGEDLPLAIPEDGRVQLEPAGGRARDELERALRSDELDGLLVISGETGFQLVAKRDPAWKPQLERALTAAKREAGVARLGLLEEDVMAILAPASLDVTLLDGGAPAGRATRITAIGIILLMVLGVIMGMTYEFLSITGEKQLRVTEQIVTAIGTQRWIDGKILGTSFVSLGTMTTYAVSAVIFVGVSWLVGRDIPLPTDFISFSALATLVPIALGGFLFWNTAFAAIAATIDDPNSSARGGFLMLPAVPLALAVLAVNNPDALMTRVLSVFPLTSPAFLAVRLSMSTVPWWEILLALALLIGSVLVMRRAAGRIFALGILMYGKEPTWGEIVRWARTA